MRLLNRYKRFFIRSWERETSLRFSTLVVLTFTYAVTLFLVNSAFNFKRIINRWGDQNQITVYLSEGQSPETRKKLSQYLQSMNGVKETRYVSQEEAESRFTSKNSIFSKDFLEDLKSQEVFPESFELILEGDLKDDQSYQKMQNTAQLIESQLGVDEVSYGQGWVERYSAFLKLSNSLIMVIVALFLLASVLIISNLVRVIVFNQKEEIEILELIGETANNIRSPFLLDGIFFSLLAYLVGLFMNVLVFRWISIQLQDSTILNHLATVIAAPSLEFMTLGAVASVLVGMGAAYWTARSINNGWAMSSRVN